MVAGHGMSASGAPSRQALTLLFTDVVGSTAMASLLGDADWTAHLKAHKRMLHKVVVGFGGRVVDETGDGVFAAFPSTSQALFAAARIARYSTTSDGELPVRVGVHSGEVEVTGPNVMGVSVHVAARVMSIAREGQVVVSRPSVDQVRGASFIFTNAGEHALKGLDGTWHLFQLNLDSALSQVPANAPPVPRGSERQLLRRPPVLAGIAVVAALLAVAGFLALRPDSQPGAGGTALVADGGGGAGAEPAPTATAAPVNDSVPPAGAPWTAVRDLEVPRHQIAGVSLPGRMVVAGGLGEKGALDTVEAYEPAINSWHQLPPLPRPLAHAMMATWQDQPVVIGGWSPVGARLTAITSDRVLILNGTKWAELPTLLEPRVAGAAVTVGKQIIVTGGQDAKGALIKTTEAFDGKAWRQVKPMPIPRDHLAAVTDGTYVYAVGGRQLSADTNLNAVERYDPAKNVWVKLAPMPTARGGAGAAVLGGKLIVVGGETPTAALKTVEGYDIKTNTWSALPAPPAGRHGAAVVVLDGSLYVIGGANVPSHAGASSSVLVLDLSAR